MKKIFKAIIYAAILVTLIIFPFVAIHNINKTNYEDTSSVNAYFIFKDNVGLYECVTNTFYKKNEYLNFQQYYFANKDKIEPLLKQVKKINIISNKVINSNEKGIVKNKLTYIIGEKTFKCIYDIDFSKKDKPIEIMEYEK